MNFFIYQMAQRAHDPIRRFFIRRIIEVSRGNRVTLSWHEASAQYNTAFIGWGFGGIFLGGVWIANNPPWSWRIPAVIGTPVFLNPIHYNPMDLDSWPFLPLTDAVSTDSVPDITVCVDAQPVDPQPVSPQPVDAQPVGPQPINAGTTGNGPTITVCGDSDDLPTPSVMDGDALDQIFNTRSTPPVMDGDALDQMFNTRSTPSVMDGDALDQMLYPSEKPVDPEPCTHYQSSEIEKSTKPSQSDNKFDPKAGG